MANVNLTKYLKDQIVQKALTKAGIFSKKSALRAARIAWAERVRLEAIGGQEAENIIKADLKKIEVMANKIPKMLRGDFKPVNISRFITLNLAGARVFAFFNGDHSHYEPNSPPAVRKITPEEFTLLADNPLVTEFYSFDALYEQIRNEEYTILQNVSAALDRVRTIKKLLEIWPEAQELLPDTVHKAASPPAIRRKDLNQMLGLPSNV